MLRAGLREVVRQIDSALFERAVLGPPKVSTALRELHPGAESVYRDAYCVEFPGLPAMRRVYSSLMPRPDSARSGVFSLVNAQMADRTPPIILAGLLISERPLPASGRARCRLTSCALCRYRSPAARRIPAARRGARAGCVHRYWPSRQYRSVRALRPGCLRDPPRSLP